MKDQSIIWMSFNLVWQIGPQSHTVCWCMHCECILYCKSVKEIAVLLTQKIWIINIHRISILLKSENTNWRIIQYWRETLKHKGQKRSPSMILFTILTVLACILQAVRLISQFRLILLWKGDVQKETKRPKAPVLDVNTLKSRENSVLICWRRMLAKYVCLSMDLCWPTYGKVCTIILHQHIHTGLLKIGTRFFA